MAHPAAVGRVPQDRYRARLGQRRTAEGIRTVRRGSPDHTGHLPPQGRSGCCGRPDGSFRTDMIRYNRLSAILKFNKLVTASPTKSRQRKWVRYERLYSNAMWHTDWHIMKDSGMKGLSLITYLDDTGGFCANFSVDRYGERGQPPTHQNPFNNRLLGSNVYCKVCGSCEMVPATIRQDQGSGKTFKPSVGMAGIGASLGSVDATTNISMTYNTVLCQICRNTTNDLSSRTNPLKISMSDYDKIVVVPYMLAIQLLALYDEHEITLIIRQHRVCFERIFRKWAKTGNNICKKSHVGKKISIKTRKITLDCWLIIDYSDVCHIRLAYGGGKIQCP